MRNTLKAQFIQIKLMESAVQGLIKGVYPYRIRSRRTCSNIPDLDGVVFGGAGYAGA